ncbi:MAG: hypothetical protein LBP85_05425 [Prevotellaceae bacterium]|jgi:hypothetical protein|nr:hypothetical protein [Prevotellaceae bacterium]
MKAFEKDFDCVEMKNTIQAKIYSETKDMNFSELRSYMDKKLQNDSFWNKISAAFKQRQQ